MLFFVLTKSYITYPKALCKLVRPYVAAIHGSGRSRSLGVPLRHFLEFEHLGLCEWPSGMLPKHLMIISGPKS